MFLDLMRTRQTGAALCVLSSESLLSPSVCVLVCVSIVSFVVVVDVECTRFSSLGNWVNGLRSLTQFSYPGSSPMMTAENS